MKTATECSGTILAVPACEPRRGGGHLTRCMALVRELRVMNRESWLFLKAEASANAAAILDTEGFDRSWLISESSLQGRNWDCIILDRFQTPPEEYARWAALGTVIGIDEGGHSRDRFDFLVDILPNLCRHKPNLINGVSGIRDQGERFESAANGKDVQVAHNDPQSLSQLKILVSFGQEDSAGLGYAAATALAAKNHHAVSITLIQGGLGDKEQIKKTINKDYPNLILLAGIPNLANHLAEYSLVITHYGLTAFEALSMGVPVLLASPTAYHEKLAKAAGFCSLGFGKGKTGKAPRLLFKKGGINYTFLRKLQKRCAELAVRYKLDCTQNKDSLAGLVSHFKPIVSRNCIACGTACGNAIGDACGTSCGNANGSPLPGSPALARFPERSYFRCKRCGTITMNRLNPPPIEYGKEYFFEQYQQQYGKTYIEDFPNLTVMAKRRLTVIKSLCASRKEAKGQRGILDQGLESRASPRLLDIGCAYGPFLAAARDEGFSPFGIDPSEDAARYVNEILGIPAIQGFFPDPQSPIPNPHYSVITLWYVIEHFRDCVPALAEIRKLLKGGGILAFSTPSFRGISGRASIRRFLEHSPADHWTLWSPASGKKALGMAGFSVKKIVNSGHHPERFPLVGRFARSKKSPLYWLLLAVSRVFSLGDTFEVYAVSS